MPAASTHPTLLQAHTHGLLRPDVLENGTYVVRWLAPQIESALAEVLAEDEVAEAAGR